LGFAALRPAGCAGYALAGRNAARRACRPGAAVVQWRDHHGDPAAMPRLLPAAFAALAALLTPPAAHAADATVLECGALFDSRSGRMLGPHAVMVRDGRIESVTAGAAAAAPGADRVDLTGHACMPGWTDLHVHLGSQSSPQSYAEGFRMDPVDHAFRAVGYAEKTLLAGFTSVRDLGGEVAAHLRDAINQGLVKG